MIDIEKAISKEGVINQVHQWQEDGTCCSSSNEEQMYRRYTFSYSKHNIAIKDDYPMVWVHFDEKLEVESVYVKRYEGLGFDDFEVYSLSNNGIKESLDFEMLFE